MSINIEQENASVQAASDFLRYAMGDDDLRIQLEFMTEHDQLIQLAKEKGFFVTRESLAEAMKQIVDGQLATSGVPTWVRDRMFVTIHD